MKEKVFYVEHVHGAGYTYATIRKNEIILESSIWLNSVYLAKRHVYVEVFHKPSCSKTNRYVIRNKAQYLKECLKKQKYRELLEFLLRDIHVCDCHKQIIEKMTELN